MIFTQDQSDSIIRELKDSFAGVPKQHANNGEITGISLTVPSIDHDQLTILYLTIKDIGCDLKLKRSGTGISIHLN